MFLELSFRLNFTFSMTNPVDGLWVGFSPEGIVQGILGVVGSGEADVGFGDMIASHDGYYYGQVREINCVLRADFEIKLNSEQGNHSSLYTF